MKEKDVRKVKQSSGIENEMNRNRVCSYLLPQKKLDS